MCFSTYIEHYKNIVFSFYISQKYAVISMTSDKQEEWFLWASQRCPGLMLVLAAGRQTCKEHSVGNIVFPTDRHFGEANSTCIFSISVQKITFCVQVDNKAIEGCDNLSVIVATMYMMYTILSTLQS